MKKDSKLIKTILSSNGLNESLKVTEFVSGQINRVYDIDNKYVVKIQADLIKPQNLFEHQVEVNQKLSSLGTKIPEVINSDTVEGKNYLLMKKINGRTLAEDWLTFSNKKKESMMAQIAEQLRLFHSIKYDQYAIQTFQKKFSKSFKEVVVEDIDFSQVDKSKLEDKHVKEFAFLEEFYSNKEYLLEKSGSPVFIHNDIHFENIFYQNDSITGIIDFDFSCQAPKEYELCLFTNFIYIPTHYVVKKLEKDYRGYNMEKEMRWLKKHYKELFAVDNLPDLIRLYTVNIIVEDIMSYQVGRWSVSALQKAIQKIQDLYKTDWLEKLIDN